MGGLFMVKVIKHDQLSLSCQIKKLELLQQKKTNPQKFQRRLNEIERLKELLSSQMRITEAESLLRRDIEAQRRNTLLPIGYVDFLGDSRPEEMVSLSLLAL